MKMSKIKRFALVLTALLIVVTTALGFLSTRQARAATAPKVYRVDSNGNITVDGVAIRIKGGNWFGLEGRHEPSNDATNPSGAPMELYIGNVFWNSSSRTYDSDIAEFKALGINLIRLPLSPQTLSSTEPQGMAPNLKNTASVVIPNSRLAVETVIKKLDAAGIYVLLDIHSCSNYLGWRAGRIDARPPYVDKDRENYDFKREDSSCAATGNPAGVTRIQAYDKTKWLADLKTLAGFETTLGVGNILGIDIFNEPWDYTWADWAALSAEAYTAINSVNTNTLVFVEGVSDSANNQDGTPATVTVEPSGVAPGPNWGGNLASAGANPPAIPKNRLVYSPHVYGPSVFVGKQFVSQTPAECAGLSGDAAGDLKCPLIMPPLSVLSPGWDSQFGYLKAQGYAIVIGEWGGNMQWPKGKANLRDQARFSYVTDTTLDQQWQNLFADYLISRGINDTIYWGLNPESGDTGGLYTTPYDPVSNTGGWGTWGAQDSTKVTLVRRLWNQPIVTGPTQTPGPITNTPVPPTKTFTPTTGPVTNTPTKTLTPIVPTRTLSRTPTRTNTPGGPTATFTRTATKTNTPVGPTATFTKTNTPVPPTATPTSGGSGGTCSPISAVITAPFTKDGVGTFCWQSSNLGGYMNSWNLTSLTVNGVNLTNVWISSGSYPAKIGGFYYVTYNGPYAWSHFEAK